MTEKLIKVSEIAQRLCVSVSAVHKWISSGDLPAIQPKKPRGMYLIKESDLDKFLSNTNEAASG